MSSHAAAASSRPKPADLLSRLYRGTAQFRPVFSLFVALFIVLSITQTGFATQANMTNVLTAVAGLWVVSMGMTFVVLTGGVDLSVAAIAALCGVAAAKLIDAGVSSGLAVLAVIVLGAVVGGVLNGGLIGGLRLSFFVVTLAALIGIGGVVALWSNVESLPVNYPAINDIGIGVYLGVQAPIWIMIGVFLLSVYLLRYTYFGRDVYAIGGSLTAARLSGIKTARTLMKVYAFSGACAAIAGLIEAGRIGSASPQVDATLPLNAAAAVLLGGTRLTGGYGGVTGTALGVLFIGFLNNGLSIAHVPSFWQQVVTGVILIVAVIGDAEGEIPPRLAWIRKLQRNPGESTD